MPLDPAVSTLMQQLDPDGAFRIENMNPADARQAFSAMAALDGDPVAVAHVEDLRIAGPHGDIALRLYRPETAPATSPVVLYFHGGGWVIGGLDTHDGTCRRLAREAGCAVVSVDYRLAPEHPYPAAPEDCFAALRFVSASARELGLDPEHIIVAGDSAGGNLAAVVALMARDRGGPRVSFQLLIYPVTDVGCDTASMRENAEGYFLTRAAMRWFWRNYLGRDGAEAEAYHSPLSAESLENLPPAFVITAEFDPLRDEGEAYARRLADSGVSVRLRRYDGMIHGFVTMAGVLPQGAAAIREAAATLRMRFGRR